jgi:hypothetical protein
MQDSVFRVLVVEKLYPIYVNRIKNNLIIYATLSLKGKLLASSKDELITNTNESNERFKALSLYIYM